MAVALIAAVAIWIDVVASLARDALGLVAFPPFGGRWLDFALPTVAIGSLTVGGMLAFAGAYVYLRHVELTIGDLDRTVLASAGGGLLAGAGLVGLAEVLAAATGTTVSAITDMAIAADAALGPALPITLLGLVVGLPTTHPFVQRSIERATGGVATVALTTIIVGASARSN